MMSTSSHCARLLERAHQAPVSLPSRGMFRRARLGPWFLFQLDEALNPPSGIRRSSTPRAKREGTGNKQMHVGQKNTSAMRANSFLKLVHKNHSMRLSISTEYGRGSWFHVQVLRKNNLTESTRNISHTENHLMLFRD